MFVCWGGGGGGILGKRLPLSQDNTCTTAELNYFTLHLKVKQITLHVQSQLRNNCYNNCTILWMISGTIYLEIPEGQLNAIDAKHRGDPQKCLMAMLTESWLPRVSPPPTWEEIAAAVEFVGYPDVAQNLRDKFCIINN